VIHDPENALQAQMANALLRANQMLGYENQLRPDDPLISFVALNETLYKAYLEALKQTTSDAQTAYSAALQKELEQAKSITTEMIEQTGRHLQDQLEHVIEAGEARIQKTAQYEKDLIQELTQLNFIGSACWFLSGVMMVGVILIKIWFG
jgi:hypothetical protein